MDELQGSFRQQSDALAKLRAKTIAQGKDLASSHNRQLDAEAEARVARRKCDRLEEVVRDLTAKLASAGGSSSSSSNSSSSESATAEAGAGEPAPKKAMVQKPTATKMEIEDLQDELKDWKKKAEGRKEALDKLTDEKAQLSKKVYELQTQPVTLAVLGKHPQFKFMVRDTGKRLLSINSECI